MKKTVAIMIFVMIMLLILLILCKFTHPAKIISVHGKGSRYYIVVDNFPFTERGKLNWWKENHVMLKESYGVPELGHNGMRSVLFWGFGKGYETERPDITTFFPSKSSDHLFCFEDMNTAARCIRKENRQMKITITSENIITYSIGDSIWYQDQSGTITKGERFVTTIN